ncbi:uncharacterized protein LOC104910021 [Meleagris gallopavo]|uniref:ribonuclease H n=1 Tax=Meleagris gallopavo TaxID=9103 RepID=A0A803XM39_MELGA|nr:uncharacterized protein LOC104910021 [Meleagris gallopavo]XP_019468902.1 uncharacterized protein LOC104910021 [Meleagris gallopavo]
MEFRNRSIRPWMEGYNGMMELQDEHKNPWVKEFPDVWARYDLDCGMVAEEEDVTWDRAPYQKEKSFQPDLDRVVASLLQQMLEEGIVVRGTSPYNSRLHVFSKKNGEKRLTLNFKAIHSVISRQPTESLHKMEVVTVLSPHSCYFSTLDLSCCSFAIPLTAASRLRFAFTFRGQQYLFTRLPPGFYLTNSIVHRRVARMLAQLPPKDKGWVSSYTDDMIIAGRTHEETASRTRRVLQLIQATGFKVKLWKAQLMQPEVDYLGMKLSARGWELQASKRERIANVPSPSDPSSLYSLLKMLGYHQDRVEDYAELELPLQRLMKEEWQWGQEQQQALRRLIQAILTAPALRFVSRSQPFIIRPTVNDETTGAALLQENEKGQMVPVWFKSDVLKKHQVFYSPEEKHCIAVVRAVHAFQDLIGTAPIVIQMPHSPWKYLLWGDTKTFCWPTPCKKQWNLLLVNGGENIPTAPQPSGALVRSAPPLQEVPSSVPHRDVWFTAGSWACTAALGFAATNLEERWLLGLMQHGSPAGVELEAIRVLLQEHRSSKPLYIYANAQSVVQGLRDGDSEVRKVGNEQLWQSIWQWVRDNPGVLHVRHSKDGEELKWNQKVVDRAQSIQAWVLSAHGQRVWEPSKHERQEIVALSHMGHVGVRKMLNRVRQVACWEGDCEQVAQWVQRCSCTSIPPQPQRTEGPWSQLQLAHVKGLPCSSKGCSSLLVLLDKFSRWVDAFPMQKGNTEEVVELLQAHVAQRSGMPCCVSVGHREHFLQEAVQTGLQMDVDVQYSPPNWVAAITTSLQRLAQSAGKRWADSLLLIVAALRATCVRREVLGPYQLCFHHPLVLRISPIEGEAAPGPTESLLLWLAQLREDRAEYKQRVEEAMESDSE